MKIHSQGLIDSAAATTFSSKVVVVGGDASVDATEIQIRVEFKKTLEMVSLTPPPPVIAPYSFHTLNPKGVMVFAPTDLFGAGDITRPLGLYYEFDVLGDRLKVCPTLLNNFKKAIKKDLYEAWRKNKGVGGAVFVLEIRVATVERCAPQEEESPRHSHSQPPPCSSSSSCDEKGKQQEEEERVPCPICLGEFKPSDGVTMRCAHAFHSACIRSWIDKSPTCPLCRAFLFGPAQYRKWPRW